MWGQQLRSHPASGFDIVHVLLPYMCVCCTALHCMAGPPVILEDLGGVMDVQQVDLTPITDLFADVTGAGVVTGFFDGALGA